MDKFHDSYRVENPSLDGRGGGSCEYSQAMAEGLTEVQFKVGNYRDSDWESNIRMLTGH